jgi:type I restriction enzyme S subunit
LKPLRDVTTFLNGLWKGEKPPYVTVGVIRNTNFAKDGSIDDCDIAWLEVETKKFEKRKLKFGDIILEKSGGGPKQPVGRVALFAKEDGNYSFSNFTSTIRINDDKELDFGFLHKFLFWKYVSGVTESMQSHSTGIRNLNVDAYKEIAVPLPPISEQKRLVAILDETFAGLAIATANVEKNLKNASELSATAFTFIFNRNAANWSPTTIGNQVTLQRGFDITKKQQNSGSVPVVSSGGIKSFHDVAMARAPGVVLGRKGSLGTVFYLDQDYWPHDTTLWVKDFKGNDPKFVYYFFNSLDLAKFDTGAANPALNRNVVHPIKVNWPSKDRQVEIVRQVESIATEAQRLQSLYQRKLTEIGDLRQSILQKAFSGELTSPPSQAVNEAAE